MANQPSDALTGALAADALSMPVHWYYDREALRRDYGKVATYLAPRNPHADSILWRSSYTALNARGEILHDQARFWGEPGGRGIHYHQFLKAGENTCNFQLAIELRELIARLGRYDADAWLEHYIEFMLTPGRHNDTYLEEYHRHFFSQYARGKKPRQCGLDDIHIGGLAAVPALFAALDASAFPAAMREHVALSHGKGETLAAAECLGKILLKTASGEPLRESILREAGDYVSEKKISKWCEEPDLTVIGQRLSPACYIKDAFTASLYLAWKYAADFDAGIIANANAGGDNCHRGAVVGSLLGLANGVPDRWRTAALAPLAVS